MRLLFSFALFLLTISPPAPDKQHSQPDEQHATTQNAPVPTSPVTVIVNQPPTQEHQPTPEHKPKNGPPIWSNWALVVVAFGTGILALRSLHQIKRQAKATEDAANAAKDAAIAATHNAQALINAERAWIAGAIENDGGNFQLFGHPNAIPKCRVGIKNYGRTPGKIITICARFDKMPDFAALPPEPYFGIDSIAPFGNDIIFPSETAIWLTSSIAGDEPLTQNERLAVRDGLIILLLWGEINYADVITSEQHLTRFCFWYTYGHPPNISGFQTCFSAPASYRKTT